MDMTYNNKGLFYYEIFKSSVFIIAGSLSLFLAIMWPIYIKGIDMESILFQFLVWGVRLLLGIGGIAGIVVGCMNMDDTIRGRLKRKEDNSIN